MADREKKRKAAHHEEAVEDHVQESEISVLVKFMMEESLRAEARRDKESKMFEARMVAAEERAEARKVAEEEKAEERREAKRQRKAEEARQAAEREAAREEAAKVASEQLVRQQEAAGAKAYEQQVALMKLQNDIGDRAAGVHRAEQEAHRKKDRAVAGISLFRDGEDVEEFLAASERKLRAGGVPEGEWTAIVAAKLGGKIGSTWQELCSEADNYSEVKAGLLGICGYTPKIAGETFYNFKPENIRGMSADQLYGRGLQLVRRMMAPGRLDPENEFRLLKPWIWSLMPRQARIVIDSRAVTKAEELVGALQDYLAMEGERREGQAAIFGRKEGSVEKRTIVCFKCGKVGHKGYECGEAGGGVSLPPANGSSNVGSVGVGSNFLKGVNCFTCGQEGHKSPYCPNRKVKAEPKEVPKFMKRVKGHPDRDTLLEMRVNGQNAQVVLDSGAAMTVVPQAMVAQAQLTGDKVVLKGFLAEEAVVLPTAKIPFSMSGSSWDEIVALGPPGTDEIIYSLDLRSVRGLELVYVAHKSFLEKNKKEDVKKEEEEEVEEEVEEEEEEEEEVGKVYRLRSMQILGFSDQSSGVVGGDPILPEELQPTCFVSNFCKDVVCVESPNEGKELLEQPEKEPRTAPVFVVGGDVGSAHRRRKRERDKEKEQDKEDKEERENPDSESDPVN